MGTAKEWPQVPEGVTVYWEGLQLVSVEPLTPEERFTVKEAKLQRYAGIPVTTALAWMPSAGACAILWHIGLSQFGLRHFWLIIGMFMGLCACLIAIVVFWDRRTRKGLDASRNKAVFRGDIEAIPLRSRLRRFIARWGPWSREVQVAVLPNGMLLSVDAWVMTHEHIMERPCPIAWTGQVGAEGTDHHTLGASQHPGDNPAQPLLSELEKEEIRMRLRHPFSVLSGPAYWGGFCLMLFALQVAEHSGTAGTLTFAAACTILWVAALLRLALAARRFKADAEDGTLDVHGDRLVLRHSRKVWSVAGKPAQWRLRGAPTDA